MDPKINCLSCLVCSNCTDESSNSLVVSSETCSTSQVSKQLDDNFLLRKVLEVPSAKLVNFLKRSPNLESWLSLCPNCTEKVNKCKSSYQSILDGQSNFRTLQHEVVELIKVTTSQEERDGFHDKFSNIMKTIRGFVYQNRYSKDITTTDPFNSKDQTAYQQLTHKVDKAPDDDDNHLLEGNGLEAIVKLEPGTSLSSCLICGRADDGSTISSDDKPLESLISEHLHVIFLLRKVLEVPSAKLVTFLKTQPNVEGWISVCDKCEPIVNLSKEIYQNILTGQSQLKRMKQEIIQSLKESPSLVKRKENEDAVKIVKEIRKFVYQNRYAETENTDPFIYGDRVCREKIEGKETKSKPSCRRSRRRPLKGRLPKPIPLSEENTYLSCKACKKTFPTSGEEFEKHMDILHVSRSKIICPRCGSKADSLDEHLKHRTKCTRQTKNKAEAHLAPMKVKKVVKKTKVDDDSNTCEYCGKVFKTPTVCRRHREFVHEKKWTCSRCGVVKWTETELDKHKLNCSDENKMWNCPVKECGLVYETVGALRIHMGKLHKGVEKIKVEEEGEKAPVICESCGATYAKRNQLSVHRSTSRKCRLIRGLGERKRDPVICQVCGKSYPNKRQLHLHVRVVHEKRFSKWCELCGMGFVGKRGLERHLWGKHKVGEGDKAWRCEVEGCTAQICGEKSRMAHMRSRHPGWGGRRVDKKI